MVRARPIRMKHNKRPVRLHHNKRPPRRHRATYLEIFVWLGALLALGISGGAVALPTAQLMLGIGLIIGLVLIGVAVAISLIFGRKRRGRASVAKP